MDTRRSSLEGSRRASLEGLLHDIYDDLHHPNFCNLDSDAWTDTSASNFSDSCHPTRRLSASTRRSIFARRSTAGSAPSGHPLLEESIDDESGVLPRFEEQTLLYMETFQLAQLAVRLRAEVASTSLLLIKHLKRREHQLSRMRARCNVVTAILQAMSPKRSVDAKLQFTLEPPMGENGYDCWLNAMRSVARLPDGMPHHFRKRLWLTLADHYVKTANVDWEATSRRAFNDRMNDDDDELSLQIVKDLHRTGWSGLSGDVERVLLKRVLLAYARYNKTIGYCQGFNVIAALILEVMEYNEEPALKVMIMLIEHVLPSGYFDQTLRALSVDMAVLRDLVHQRLPKLSAHLDHLQISSESEFEPPLTNVFSMQWFLTLFATCLPKQAVFRIWDSLMLEGSEILLRAALAIWAKTGRRIYKAKSADSYYTLMGHVSQELLHMNNDQCNDLMQVIYSMAEFPYPGLSELRDRYTWNIQPFSSAFRLLRQQVVSILKSDDENGPESVSGSPRHSTQSKSGLLTPPQNGSRASTSSTNGSPSDLSKLEKQYKLIRQRQKQAAVILQNALASSNSKSSRSRPMIPPPKNGVAGPALTHSNGDGDIFNHLYLNRTAGNSMTTLNGTFAVAPRAIQPAGQTKPRQPQACSKIQDSIKTPANINFRRLRSDDSATSADASTVVAPTSPGPSLETGSLSTPTSSGGGSTPGLWSPFHFPSFSNWNVVSISQINCNKIRRHSAGDVFMATGPRHWHSCSELSTSHATFGSTLDVQKVGHDSMTNGGHFGTPSPIPPTSPGPLPPPIRARTRPARPSPLDLQSLISGLPKPQCGSSSISGRVQPMSNSISTVTNGDASTDHAALLKKSKAILASVSSVDEEQVGEPRRSNAAIRNPFPVKRQTALIERGKRLGLYS